MNGILKLKDKELINQFDLLVKKEKEAVAAVVAHLAEIDRRKLYVLEGYSSLFNYCVQKYHYSESEAFLRIQAARLVHHSPEVIGLLEENKATLTTLKLIAPHITSQNKEKILKEVEHKTKRETEYLVATLFPSEEKVEDRIRKLPTPGTERTAQNLTRSGTSTLVNKETIKPLTPKRFKIVFVADEKMAQKIERAKALLRHKYPKARLEDIFNEALELLLEKRDPSRTFFRRKNAQSEKNKKRKQLIEAKDDTSIGGKRPQGIKVKLSKPEISENSQTDTVVDNNSSSTRYISQEIRREVFKRDYGTCVYQASDGKRCGERNFLEFDHIQPFALGGKSTAENLQLLCRTHNLYRGQQTFGVVRS